MFWKKTNDNTVKEWTENSLAAQAKLAAVKILWTEMMAKEPQSLISPMQIDQASMLDLWISIRLGSFTGWFDNNYEFDVAQTADLTKQVELMAPLCNRVGRHRWNKKTKELNTIVTFQYKALLNWGFEVGEKTSSDNYLFKKLNNVENVNFF